jgi:methionine transaminase
MPLFPTSRLPTVGVSIFTVMSRLAEEHGAINLSQGFPDFDAAPELTALAGAWFSRGCNQYAPMAGVMRLREELAAQFERRYGARYDPAGEITITAGATEAIFSAITALVHPRDEVLLFEPCYDSYVPAVQLAGGVPVFVTLRYPEYAIDWDEVRRRLSLRTRLVVVNSPHNPTGAMFGRDDLLQLAALLEGTPVIVLSDEVYEHLTFDGRQHVSVSSLSELASRAAVVSSFGKSFHTTGWKVGFVAAPAAITDEIRRVHQFVTFAVNTPLQHAYAEFLARGVDFAAVGRFYEAKRDRFLALVRGSTLRPLPCAGTYFVLMDYAAVGAAPDGEMAMRLLREHGVASIPTSAFLYATKAPPVLRFCFAKRDETLALAAERLSRV